MGQTHTKTKYTRKGFLIQGTDKLSSLSSKNKNKLDMLEYTKNIVKFTDNAGFPRDALTDKTKPNNSTTTETFPISSVSSINTIVTLPNKYVQITSKNIQNTPKFNANAMCKSAQIGTSNTSILTNNYNSTLKNPKQQNNPNNIPCKIDTPKSIDGKTKNYKLNQTETEPNVNGTHYNADIQIQRQTISCKIATDLLNTCITNMFNYNKINTIKNKLSDSAGNSDVVQTTHNSYEITVQAPPSPNSYKHIIINFWPDIVNSEWSNFNYAKIYEIVKSTGVPNYLKARIPLPSGLKIQNWNSC